MTDTPKKQPKREKKAKEIRTPFHVWLDALTRHAGLEPVPPKDPDPEGEP